MHTHARRGLTIVEVLTIMGILLIVLVLVVGLMLPPRGYCRCLPYTLRDASYLRSLHQSMVRWAAQNNDTFPLPSLVDMDDTTVANIGLAKDTTANIMSMMVWNGAVPPELLISPLEMNRRIVAYEDYAYDHPSAAIDPDRAHWDPSLSADFTIGEGNVSYAHLMPSGDRRHAWRDTEDSTQVVLGSRGPQIESVRYEPNGAVTPFLTDDTSTTLQPVSRKARSSCRRCDSRWRSGRPGTWNPVVAFNDNRVELLSSRFDRGSNDDDFEPVAFRDDLPWLTRPDGTMFPDLLTYDEPRHPGNTFLGIFTTAGEKPADFTPIWD